MNKPRLRFRSGGKPMSGPKAPKLLSAAARPRRSRVRTMPQELIDQVIDYSKDQRDTLLSCSLVSRAFVHRSQQHLFAKIILYPSLEIKLKILFETSSHLASYTKELSISVPQICSSPLATVYPEGSSHLLDVLPKFTNLKRFTMRIYGYGVLDWNECVPEDIQTGIASIFEKNMLHEVVLQDVQEFDPGLLARCSSLQMLVLGGESSLSRYTEPLPDSCAPPALSVAMVGSGEKCFQSFMDCCNATLPAFSLNKLQWLGLRELPGDPWIESFHKLAKSSLCMLKHLVIELEIKAGTPGERSPSTELERIDLSGLKNLLTIEIRNNSYEHDQTLFGQRSARILQSLPRPSQLVHITFYCPGQQFATHHTPSRQSHWDDVDLVLSNGFPRLSQVHFKFGVN
ncbi:hypothetical protein BDN70DRAFT_238634 [Pholiota conissans]|uniref:F-box domain-containing protein n=1 Tax=Pholiota conissans TaxID=109636 RepID=A0A9P5ZEH3_9AGAR|nr:hypothetical protein BDN70DRAFT_238634 [Pholiota conissans]